MIITRQDRLLGSNEGAEFMSGGYIETLLQYGVLVAVNQEKTDGIMPSKGHVFHAEFGEVGTDRALIDMIAGAFNCPEPYGRNWDALHEVLRTMDWFQWNSVVLRLRNAKRLLNLPPATVVVLLKILSNSSLYWKRKGKTFLTLMEGDKELYRLVYQVLSDWHLKSIPEVVNE
jgi:Barstar (barnase inhibitor)